MHADCFAGVEFKTIVRDPILTLFTHSCISLCACRSDFASIQKAKSSTSNDASEPYKTDFTILIILRLHKQLVQVIGLQLLGSEDSLLGLGIATMATIVAIPKSGKESSESSLQKGG